MAVKQKSPRGKSLSEYIRENPFAFISFEDAAELFHFGKDVITALAKIEGFPVVARKVNPGILLDWLRQNAGAVGKIRGDS